jgi:hypothetical protein
MVYVSYAERLRHCHKCGIRLPRGTYHLNAGKAGRYINICVQCLDSASENIKELQQRADAYLKSMKKTGR